MTKEYRRLISILEDTVRDLVEYEHEQFPERAELAYRKRQVTKARCNLMIGIEELLDKARNLG